jgi:hypothetical protein
MAAAREYGHAGTVGIAVPQANTTVEAEFRALALPGVNIVTARLQGSRSDSRTRLLDYFHGLDATLDTFDTAPLGAVGFACTARRTCWAWRRTARSSRRFRAAGATPWSRPRRPSSSLSLTCRRAALRSCPPTRLAH